MERQQVLAIYNRYLTNNDPDTAIRAMQDLYNRVVVSVLPIGQQEDALINLTEKEASFKNTMLKTLGLDISLWLEN
jgi:predicted P-loop ATPase